jgi:hypothetical protein
MALSNMLREPRREITETVVGVLLIGIVLVGYISGACWLAARTNLDMPAAFFLELTAASALVLFVLVGHWIGETVCDALQDHGVHLRPQKRRR